MLRKFLFPIIFCLFLFGCTNPIVTGYIIEVNETHIWVVDAKESEISNKSEQEVKEAFENQGTYYNISNIPNETIEKLTIGSKVTITTNGNTLTSAPAKADALKIKVVEE